MAWSDCGICALGNAESVAREVDQATHLSTQQIIDLCMSVGLSTMVKRFHATFLADVDKSTLAEMEAGNATAGTCPMPLPKLPLSCP